MSKKILITGANGWLGRTLVSTFLREWYFVYAWVKTLSQDMPEVHNLQYIELDITNRESVESCKQEIEQAGGISILINNAGVSGWWSFWKREMEIDKHIFEVNLWGSLMMAKTFWDMLEIHQWVLVNIGSISWNTPTPFLSAYSASKAALEKMMLGLYLEKKHPSVRVLHLQLWPLDKGMCGNDLANENEPYNEKVRKHMVKIQNLHALKTDDVASYILKFTQSKTRYSIKTLGFWAKCITFFSKCIPQPHYQKIIGKLYRSM